MGTKYAYKTQRSREKTRLRMLACELNSHYKDIGSAYDFAERAEARIALASAAEIMKDYKSARQDYMAAIGDLKKAAEIQERTPADGTLADLVRENMELAAEGLRVNEARIRLREYATAQS